MKFLILTLVFLIASIWGLIKLYQYFFNKPEALRYWGVLYFGDRGSGKTLHQASQILAIFKYWNKLYKEFPNLKHGIVITNQKMTAEALKGNEDYYYYFEVDDYPRYCPRKICWRSADVGDIHQLHGAVVVLDDISTFLPADGWATTPLFMRKQWTQAQHLGLHFLFNCQDPLAYDINARRATDMSFKFFKIIGSERPDETAKPIKTIWGFYRRYKVKAKWLWTFGDLEPEQIGELKEGLKAKKQISGRSPYSGIFTSSYHLINKKKSEVYDTLQDVKAYEPKGYIGIKEYDCIDPAHNHTEKDLANYTKFKKNEHELI